MNQFVCDGTCSGNEFGDCNHGDSNSGLRGYLEFQCLICGIVTHGSTINAGVAYDGGEHCGRLMRKVRWIPHLEGKS
jgi:hypothetical protein